VDENEKNTSTIEDIIYIDALECYVIFGKGYYLIDEQTNSRYVQDYAKFSFGL